VERLPLRRHAAGGSPWARARNRRRIWQRRIWQRTALLAGAATLAGLVLPSGVGSAAISAPQPSLNSLVAQAKQLSNQINNLSEQYDGLRIQLSEAQAETKIARTTFAMDMKRLGASELAVGQVAAESYMNGGFGTPLQVLTSSNAQTLMSRAAIMQQLQTENGYKVSALSTDVAATRHAQETAAQQTRRAAALSAKMAAKTKIIQNKINTLNSAAFRQAMAVFNKTGQYPNIDIPTSNTVGAEALRYALTRRGDPYVWGAAGPSEFDCSGLVLWAYAQVGISLEHFTGDQWTEGEHISRSQLQPGDLVFFFPDIGHVGLYIGDGLMVDAPDFGQDVQVQPVMWNVYVGAVRIVA
jgi:cell wall-associated NlpC family hydrolase